MWYTVNESVNFISSKKHHTYIKRIQLQFLYQLHKYSKKEEGKFEIQTSMYASLNSRMNKYWHLTPKKKFCIEIY